MRMRSSSGATSSAVTPFDVIIGDDQLKDLRQRLAGTRWPEPETAGDWSRGVPLSWL